MTTAEASARALQRAREEFAGERDRETKRRYYGANRDEVLKRQRQHRGANRDEVLKRQRLWRAAHPDVARAAVSASKAKARSAVFDHYGLQCVCCGSTDGLSIDHINGDGREHRIELFGTSKCGGDAFYRWLIRENFPDGYQVLCMACNSSKKSGVSCRLEH